MMGKFKRIRGSEFKESDIDSNFDDVEDELKELKIVLKPVKDSNHKILEAVDRFEKSVLISLRDVHERLKKLEESENE